MAALVVRADGRKVVFPETDSPSARRAGTPRTTASRRHERIRTDGGTASEESATDEDRKERLQTLFVDVTGTETLVERQDREEVSRVIDAETESTASEVSEYVTDMARDDGLSETLAEPDSDGSFDDG